MKPVMPRVVLLAAVLALLAAGPVPRAVLSAFERVEGGPLVKALAGSKAPPKPQASPRNVLDSFCR
jgi:hypothetical protein